MVRNPVVLLLCVWVRFGISVFPQIVDAVGEAWVFHISADPTHKSAYWAAQRVPEGHFVVIANAFVIREIDPEDRDHFMWSSNLFSSTREHGLWDGEGKLDFSAVLGKYDDRPWYTSTRLYRCAPFPLSRTSRTVETAVA